MEYGQHFQALQAQTPRYSQPATPPVSPAELGLPGASHQQVAPGMHHMPVQMVPGPSRYQIQSPLLPMAGPSTSQQHIIGIHVHNHPIRFLSSYPVCVILSYLVIH